MRRSLPSVRERDNSAPRSTLGALLPVLRAVPRAALPALLTLAALFGLAGCADTWPIAGKMVQRTGEEGAPALSDTGRVAGVDTGERLAGSPPNEDIPYIRVGLAHGVKSAAVSSRGAFTVSVYADSAESWEAGSRERWRFGAAGGGITGSGAGGGFHVAQGTVRVRPEGGSLLVFDDTAYRGEIELFSSGASSLTVVNVIDIESYLRGVVPREIGARPESEIEAVKAQAVAARTYAMASGGRRAAGGFDVYGTVEDQVYAGADVEDPVCDEAIAATAGLYLTKDEEPIHAYFHANCGGQTESREQVWELPAVPYLRSVVDSPGEDRFNDAYCSGAPHFRWTESWSGDELAGIVQQHLPETASTPVRKPLGDLRGIRVTERTPSGRVRWLEVELSSGTYRVFGDRVRWLLRRPGSGGILWSSCFELDAERTGGGRVARLTARGRGNGHGVGMCQQGALEMARRGHGFADILSHYYKGIGIVGGYGETP